MRERESVIEFGVFVREFIGYISTASRRERFGLTRIIVSNIIEDIRTKSPEKDIEPLLAVLDLISEEISQSDGEDEGFTPLRLILLDQMGDRIKLKPETPLERVGRAIGQFVLDAFLSDIDMGSKSNGNDGRGVCEGGTDSSRNTGESQGREKAGNGEISECPRPIERAEVEADSTVDDSNSGKGN